MTVSTEVNQAAYTGNGVTTVFPYTFRILNASNLTVTRIDLQEVETVLTLGTDYTVTGSGSYNGGSVVLSQPLQSNHSLVIIRDLAAIQETDLRNQGTFFAEVHEDVFDYLTMLIQQVTSWLGLALRRPTIKSKFYDAKQYRIANLADPVNAQDAVNNRTMMSYVEKMIAGITGGYGWFLQTGAGAVFRTFQDKMRDAVNARDFGVKADGVSNDTVALKNAISSAANNKISEIRLPSGQLILTESIVIPAGVSLIGEGIDYWDTYRPAPDRLLKSWNKGTHLVFKGTGIKANTFLNLANARDYKKISGTDVPFTEFTNRDSVNGAPATAKPMSVAVTATHGSQIKNLRIMLNNNGIDGYNSTDPSLKGDEWDIGLWVYDGNAFNLDNVQVVGYWKKISTLVTENDGSYTMVGNPESAIFNNLYTQGMRGLAIRNSPQWDVTAYTSSSITCKYNSSWTLTAQNSFKITGSATLYSFTGYSVSGSLITLTGVTPALTALPLSLRAPNIGNNFSGTSFNNTKINAFDHTSGQSAVSLGLGRAASMEIDGYPMRNLKFENFKSQTINDDVNTIFGDMRDSKFINSEFENGQSVAYSNTETIGFTGNMRFFNTDPQSTTTTSSFNPRELFSDYQQMPTRNNDGLFVLKNWRAKNFELQYSTGTTAILLRDADLNSEFSNGNGFRYLRSQGSTNGLTLWGAGFDIQNTSNLSILQGFDASRNMTFAATMTGPTLAVSTAVRPATAGVGTCGTTAQPWATGYTVTAFTVTSDESYKQQKAPFPNELLDAWGELEWLSYKLNQQVEEFGDSAEKHAGLIAQQVMAAMLNHGINPVDWGIVQWGEWDDQLDENGNVTLPAGSRYTLNYTEAMCVEAAFNRRELNKQDKRIKALESNIQ
ncbi:glycosyl hydrolase family 28-related protein [Rahnella bonaserana]|uniref:tail fiber domain-containing protein n=1 Tax=Rahnella bonaserana TaxID=2816248 RepID=UPI0024C32539|nr:glycosyl hydrolase family 28-related protein [Rahnella bonaserana]WHZ42208.1 glycosyl hydrolase family 28-related protein [Rahnella bonaserana]